MKKNFLVLIASGVVLLSACGPSAEEKAAAEKATQDSIAAVEKAYQDSIAMAQQAAQDSINAAMEKMRQDSIAMADSIAMLKGKVKSATKPKPATKKEEPKTIGTGKPAMGVPSGTKADTIIGKGKPKMGGH